MLVGRATRADVHTGPSASNHTGGTSEAEAAAEGTGHEAISNEHGTCMWWPSCLCELLTKIPSKHDRGGHATWDDWASV